MSYQYISTVDTAKMIRKALKEAFPEIKFSVKSSIYSGGSSINVKWEDGPNEAQVEAVSGNFSGAYFDGSQDYKGSTYAMIDGKQVKFGADFVFTKRTYSDVLVQKAIDRVYRKYLGNFKDLNIEKPTVQQFRNGQLWNINLFGGNWNSDNLQSLVYQTMGKMSDRLAVQKSVTAGKVIYLGNDGYSDRGALQVSE